nr:EF-hand domain pair [Tanacetum cinerariifolium]
ELFTLACRPTLNLISVNSCVVNDVRFVVHSRDERQTTQNSGICSPGGKDGELYYGQLQEILDFLYIFSNLCCSDLSGSTLATKDVKSNILSLETTRHKSGQKVIVHVNHKNFSSGGVIVVEDDPDVIHFNNSSNLELSTSLNDLDFETLHIDGQSTDVDAPPNIINVDENDDDINDEDALPHDLADSDDEDLVNVDDDDDDVDVVYFGGGDDRPPSHQHLKPQFGWQESGQAAYPPGDSKPQVKEDHGHTWPHPDSV